MAKPPFKKHRPKRLNDCLKTMLSSLQPINRLQARRQAGAHCNVSPGAHCKASRHKPTHMTTWKQSTMDAFTAFSILTQALPSAKTIFKVLYGISNTKLNQKGAGNDKQAELHVVPTEFLASSCFEAILLSTVGCCARSNASGAQLRRIQWYLIHPISSLLANPEALCFNNLQQTTLSTGFLTIQSSTQISTQLTTSSSQESRSRRSAPPSILS